MPSPSPSLRPVAEFLLLNEVLDVAVLEEAVGLAAVVVDVEDTGGEVEDEEDGDAEG